MTLTYTCHPCTVNPLYTCDIRSPETDAILAMGPDPDTGELLTFWSPDKGETVELYRGHDFAEAYRQFCFMHDMSKGAGAGTTIDLRKHSRPGHISYARDERSPHMVCADSIREKRSYQESLLQRDSLRDERIQDRRNYYLSQYIWLAKA